MDALKIGVKMDILLYLQLSINNTTWTWRFKTGPRGPRSSYNKRCTMLRGLPGSTYSLKLPIIEEWVPGS